jgi:hypothetical protein
MRAATVDTNVWILIRTQKHALARARFVRPGYSGAAIVAL